MKHTTLLVSFAAAVAVAAASFAFAQVVPNVAGGPASKLQRVPVSGIHMGPPAQMKNPYAGNRQAWLEGKKLYRAMNCAGCHAPGGGGAIGPALSDNVWIYGGSPGQIYLSILHGRPNGMPQWGTVLPPNAIWALVTYVETLSQPNPTFEPATIRGIQSAPGNTAHPPAKLQPPPNPKAPTPRTHNPPTAPPPSSAQPRPAPASTGGPP